MRIRPLPFVFVGFAWWLQSLTFVQAKAQEAIDFEKQIAPILQKNCVACHHKKEAEGGVLLESYEGVMKGGDNGLTVVPGKGSESLLVALVSGKKEPLMPPADNTVGAKRLTQSELDLLTRWIDQGAKPGTKASKSGPNWSKVSSQLKPIYTTSATMDGQFVAVGRGNQIQVHHWPQFVGNARTELLVDPQVASTLGAEAPQGAHLDFVQSLAFASTGDLLASGGYREVKIWKRASSKEASLPEPISKATMIALSHDGKQLAGVVDRSVLVLDLESQKVKWRTSEVASPQGLLRWSPNGQLIAFSDEEGNFRAWKLSKETEGQEVPLKESLSCSLGQQGKELVLLDDETFFVLGADQNLYRYAKSTSTEDPSGTWKPERLLSDLSQLSGLSLVSLSPIKIAVGAQDGRVRVVKWPAGEVEATWDHGAAIRLVASTSDRKMLASVGENGYCKLWNVADGKLVVEATTDHELFRSMRDLQRSHARQKTKIDQMVAKVPELEKVKTAEVESKGKQKAVRDKAAEALASKMGELDKAKNIAAESEKSLAAAKLAVEEAMKKLEAASKEVESKKEGIAKVEKEVGEAMKEVAKNDQVLVAADEAIARATDAIPKFQLEIEKEKSVLAKLDGELNQVKELSNAASPPLAVQFTADASRLITVHADRSIRQFRVAAGKPESKMKTEIAWDGVVSMAALADGRMFVATKTGNVQGWQAPGSWTLVATIGSANEDRFSDRVTTLDFSSDGSMLLVGSGPPSRFGDLKILSTKDWSIVHDFGEAHSDTILSARFSPDGRWIASGGADKIIRIFETSGKFVRTLEGHTHHVLGLSWNDDGQSLASASADATVKVWDVFSGQQQRTITGFGKEVTAIHYVGQTNQIVTASADRIARLHDASNGKLVRSFDPLPDALYSASSIEDGPTILAGGQDGSLAVWKTDNSKPIQTMK